MLLQEANEVRVSLPLYAGVCDEMNSVNTYMEEFDTCTDEIAFRNQCDVDENLDDDDTPDFEEIIDWACNMMSDMSREEIEDIAPRIPTMHEVLGGRWW